LAQANELERTILWVSHIVIAHGESRPHMQPELRPQGWHPDPPNPERSVEEARQIADRLAERLARQPEDFAAVAREFSDDVVSRNNGGSLGGVHAHRLPMLYLDALAALRVEELSRVIRIPLGFVILKRREPPADREISGERILFHHRDALPPPEEGVQSRRREEALAAAEQVVERVRAGVPFETVLGELARFDDTQSGNIGAWSTRNPGEIPLEIEALDRVRVGELVGPIETPYGFAVLKRTAVTSPRLPDADPPARFELPSPEVAQLKPMIEEGDGKLLALNTRELAKQAVAAMQLDSSKTQELAGLFEELAAFFENHASPEEGAARAQSFERAQAAFLTTLGPARHRQLNAVIDAWITRQIMGSF
jgi:parvulin-like peptidyl-prolyl isomerase